MAIGGGRGGHKRDHAKTDDGNFRVGNRAGEPKRLNFEVCFDFDAYRAKQAKKTQIAYRAQQTKKTQIRQDQSWRNYHSTRAEGSISDGNRARS